MKKILLFSLVFVLLFSFTVLAQDTEDSKDEVNINRNITLLVEEKNPSRAYALSLLPIFGPQMSANYVSGSPLDWNTDEELKRKADIQTILNIAAIGGGIAADIGTETPGLFSLTGYLLSLVHNHFFGNNMAQTTVNYNKDLHENFKWSYPEFRVDF